MMLTQMKKCLLTQPGALFAMGTMFLLISCSDKKEEVPKADLTQFSGIYSSYLKSCGECHEPDNVAYQQYVTNLDMSSEAKAYISLMLVAGLKAKVGLGCPQLAFVKPGRASQSLLYAILDVATADIIAEGSDVSCKPKYHTRADGGVANDPTQEQKEAIRSWIEKGAPRN